MCSSPRNLSTTALNSTCIVSVVYARKIKAKKKKFITDLLLSQLKPPPPLLSVLLTLNSSIGTVPVNGCYVNIGGVPGVAKFAGHLLAGDNVKQSQKVRHEIRNQMIYSFLAT